MNSFIRATVVPFFVALFPLVWYINRNLTTDRLPPYVEPSTVVVLGALLGAVAISAVFGALVAVLTRTDVESERRLPYHRRVLRPDTTSLNVFLGFIGMLLLWAPVGLVGVGPDWLAEALLVLLVPFGIPFLVLAPFAMHFHWAVVLGLVLSVLWMSLLAVLITDKIIRPRFG